MSYDSQRGGISGAPDPFAVPEVQLDCDGTGANGRLPGGQGHDKPLPQVGTYTQPDCTLDTGILARDTQGVKKGGGAPMADVPVWMGGS